MYLPDGIVVNFAWDICVLHARFLYVAAPIHIGVNTCMYAQSGVQLCWFQITPLSQVYELCGSALLLV